MNPIIHELICPLCRTHTVKQIPLDKTLKEFHLNWYFCCECSYHFKIITEEKRYA